MEQLGEIIEMVAENPTVKIRDLGSTVIDFTSRTEVKKGWEGSFKLMPTDSTVDARFTAICKSYPDRIAVALRNQELTYADLDSRVNGILATLIKEGVTPGQPVGLCMDRSFDMIASMLAILRAGACFVPLDPSYPVERLRFMISDTQVTVIIVSEESRQFLPTHSAAEVLPAHISREAAKFSVANHGTNDPAYIMYTSGSTGTPKGVVIPHRAIVRLVNDQEFLPFSNELVFLQLSNTSFDASTLEIWGALLNGAKLVLQPQQKPTLDEICESITNHQVTTVWLTTGLFNLLVDEHLKELKSLKQILTGGDVLSVPHVNKAFGALGPGVLYNGYGPTENTTFTCTYRIDDIKDISNGVPIGSPISDTTAVVLDSSGNRTAVGEEGELYAGGNGLALGYWNRPDLTDERFIKNPFNPSEKLYRTGDLVKWNADGNIAFVGRADGQVKVRGFRVELGEIEKAMDSMSNVKDRVVICRQDNPGQKDLVAYVVPSKTKEDNGTLIDLSDHQTLSAEVRTHLETMLPSHMMPSAIVVMEQLPLTANGKVDKRALPAPEKKSVRMEAEYVAPRDNLERILAGIWSDLLKIDRIGVRDNFFEVGGHSLIGIQLFSAIKSQLGKELPLKTLFHAPTIAAQARIIKDQGWSNNWQNLTAIQPEGSRVPFFAVHADEANYFIPKAWGKDQPYYGFFHQGEDGHKIQYTSVEEIARHFIQELRSVKPHGPYLLGGYSFGGIVAFEMAQQLRAMGESVPLLALFDTYDPVEYRKVMEEESKFYDGIKKSIMRRMAHRYLKRGKILPGKLRHFYIIDTYDEAIRNYRAKPYDGTITVLKAKNSTGTERMGWDRWATSLDVKVLPGDHYSIVKEPHVYDLAKALNSSIEGVLKNIGVEAI
jgi:aspartate racemase